MNFMTFHILGISSSQLTNSYFSEFRGLGIPPTSYKLWWSKKSNKHKTWILDDFRETPFEKKKKHGFIMDIPFLGCTISNKHNLGAHWNGWLIAMFFTGSYYAWPGFASSCISWCPIVGWLVGWWWSNIFIAPVRWRYFRTNKGFTEKKRTQPDQPQIVMVFSPPGILQWEFQDPKMEVLYHIRPYFVGIFPEI